MPGRRGTLAASLKFASLWSGSRLTCWGTLMSRSKTMSGAKGRFNRRSRRTVRGALIAVLVIGHVAILGWEGYGDSATWDEVGHFAAGLEHWRHGTFRVNAVNPPLVHLVALAPVAIARPDLDPMTYAVSQSAGSRPEFTMGQMLAADIGPAYFTFLTYARWMCIPFSLIGAFVCYRWSMERFGADSGLLALAMWCISPSILAYGHLITSDMGATALGVTAAYVFRRWLHSPSIGRAAASGAVLGLAELTKTTWIILFGVWPILWLAYRLLADNRQGRPSWPREAGQIAFMLILALWTINLGYGFEGSFKRLDEYRFVSSALRGAKSDRATAEPALFGNRFARSPLRRIRVPLPENYVLGIDSQKLDFERRMPSYLRGEWRDDGWWYYYLYALLIKEPLGTWALLLAAIGVVLWRASRYEVRLGEDLLLIVPAAAVLALVSSQTGFNHHVRYVMPCLPFVFIFMSRLGRSFTTGRRLTAVLVCIAFGASAVSSLAVVPHSMSYFNALAGGPYNGSRCLGNSNADWGQDLLYLKTWYDRHPKARPLYLAYDMPLIDPHMLGIEWRTPPVSAISSQSQFRQSGESGPRPGWYVISVNSLHDRSHDYDYLKGIKPVDWIGYTLPVYHLTAHDVSEIRLKLGLQPLKAAAK